MFAVISRYIVGQLNAALVWFAELFPIIFLFLNFLNIFLLEYYILSSNPLNNLKMCMVDKAYSPTLKVRLKLFI